ncbi:MAG TPA: condensation domain-containing protein, partial [Thermoanaerobaculia bacterium]
VRSEYLPPGYWRRPELTRAAFLPDPDGGNRRTYRTGDLGRLRPDGCLEHLGRKDFQVKVRGHRIELAEIETALLALPAVVEAAVVARDDARGEKELVAFVVAGAGAALSGSELRRSLQQKLPEPALPADYVFLETLPLTPNGKVDRRALIALAPARRGPTPDPSLTPRTRIEESLAGIWARVLGVERVGLDDDFLDLGGHSLTAMQIISRVADELAVDLPPRVVWEAPTVAKMAELVSRRLAEDADAEVTGSSTPARIARRADAGPAPLSFPQQRLWFLHRLDPDSPAYNSGKALQLTGRLDAAALQGAIDAVVARHESLRTTVAVIDETPVQIVADDQRVELAFADLSVLPADERERELARRLAAETTRPFSLERDLPIRATLLRLEAERHVLHLATHHVAFDVWSTRIFFRELAAFYEAFVSGKTAAAAPLPIQYADFSLWQRSPEYEELTAKQLAFWKTRLAGELPVLELPTDRPRPPVQSYSGARRSLRLPSTLHADLLALGRRERVTLFVTLVAAFQALMHRYSGQDDVVVGTPVANRSRLETERLIGFFANTLALRVDLSGEPTFRELLGRVREVVLEAWENQELPFERLVEELQPRRSLAHSPLFQVFFDLKN